MTAAALKSRAPVDRTVLIAKEYEDFAYIVSHDLNAPLRHVTEFTRLLIGSRHDGLNDEEREYVGILEKSLQRLGDMQQALLTFSRLNTRAGPLRETDCNEIVAKVLGEMDDVINEHYPAIECGDLPVVMADAQQLTILFANLIGNALKFHDGLKKRKVSISAEDQGDIHLFRIADNGIGIDPQYHDVIFRMFRRLNADKYPGVGAGLTIAQKIVQRHGGEILIESKPDEGTSVFFSVTR